MLDYQGNPQAKTRTRLETIFRDIVGTIWVDEHDRIIVKLQGHFMRDFKVGAGLLADVKQGSSFQATFRKVNNEAWLLDEMGGKGRVRVLLFVNFNGSYSLTASDYRKFRTTTTLIPTNREIDANGNPIQPPQKLPQ
ncbi:MAG: hypothetical protein ABI142_14230 [Bryocella sp.]